MQALYMNSDGSYSVGVVEGKGMAPCHWDYDPRVMRPTVQVRFQDTDQHSRERIETLFADDEHLTLGVLSGSMVSVLTKHAR